MPSKARAVLRYPLKLINKIACVFDDLPFVFKGLASGVLETIGSFLLIIACFIMFPMEIGEGMSGIRKALKLPKGHPKRKVMLSTNIAKILIAAGGLGVTAALLVVTILSLSVASSILTFLIPTAMTGISGTELVRKYHDYKLAKQMPAGEERDAAIVKTRRSLVFASIYFGLIASITALAFLGTLGALGVVSFGSYGIIPSAILVGIVVVSVAIKVFQMVDKHYDYKFTNKITDTLSNIFGNVKEPQKKSSVAKQPVFNNEHAEIKGPEVIINQITKNAKAEIKKDKKFNFKITTALTNFLEKIFLHDDPDKVIVPPNSILTEKESRELEKLGTTYKTILHKGMQIANDNSCHNSVLLSGIPKDALDTKANVDIKEISPQAREKMIDSLTNIIDTAASPEVFQPVVASMSMK